MKFLPLLLGLPGALVGQNELDRALGALRATPYRIPEIERVVELGGKGQAKEILESALQKAKRSGADSSAMNEASMVSIAILMSLDDKHAEALQYLRGRVAEAAALKVPEFFSRSADGKVTSLRPEFLEWARINGQQDPMVVMNRINLYALDIGFLVTAGDRESVDRIAAILESNQHALVFSAIHALAQLDTRGTVFEASLKAATRLAQSDSDEMLNLGVALMPYADRSPAFQARLRAFLGNERYRVAEDEHRRLRGPSR